MVSAHEYRDLIIAVLKKQYREFCKVENSIRKLSRKYKDQRCRAALLQDSARERLELELSSWRESLLDAFCRLPEVNDRDLPAVIAFCRKLTARKPRRKYMKNQMELCK